MPQPPNDINQLDMPIGYAVNDWTPPPAPDARVLQGAHCRLERLDFAKHGEQLFDAHQQDLDARNWVYLPYGPFDTLRDYREWMLADCMHADPHFYAIIMQASQQPVGVASYLNINPAHGSIEVGHIHYAPALQRTTAATEAMFLMMQNAFALGYRRYEWKCNALNQKSCRAAERLGFRFEGVFRQMMVVKGRNRDTAWYSVIDHEWPQLQRAYQTYLAAENFDPDGRPRARLSALTQEKE